MERIDFGPNPSGVCMASRPVPRWTAGLVAKLRAFGGESRGTVAVMVGLSATVLIGLAGGATDYTRLVARRSHLQRAVDAGLMAGGNALKLVATSNAAIAGITRQTIETQAKADTEAGLAIAVDVAGDRSSVSARAEETVKFVFGAFVGMTTTTISASGRANLVGKMRLCMLALDTSAKGAFLLQKNAQVTANECSIYSDSTDASGLIGRDGAYARAQTICSAGGFASQGANFLPSPQTGCPTIQDPLRDRPAPSIGDCIQLPWATGTDPSKIKNVVTTSTTLEPGTYCGGLQITEAAVVTLKPGIYVMKDGPLAVNKTASLNGDEVGFYFMGNKGGLIFDKKTSVSLRAPTTGVMAGLLMFEERAVAAPEEPPTDAFTSPTPPPISQSKPLRTYRIVSDNARTLLGTIYLPTGRLVIDGTRPVGDLSAYTVIVAQQINLYEGPNLYLNANYAGSSVPVPAGVGPLSGQVMLTQ